VPRIKIFVKNVDKVMRAIAPERWERAIDSILQELATATLSQFRKIAPVRTGYLRASAYIVERRRGYIMRVDAPYAAAVEFGSRPHVIMPRRARALRFYIGGREVFARYVRHPGTRATYVVRRSLEFAFRQLRNIVRQVMRYV